VAVGHAAAVWQIDPRLQRTRSTHLEYCPLPGRRSWVAAVLLRSRQCRRRRTQRTASIPEPRTCARRRAPPARACRLRTAPSRRHPQASPSRRCYRSAGLRPCRMPQGLAQLVPRRPLPRRRTTQRCVDDPTRQRPTARRSFHGVRRTLHAVTALHPEARLARPGERGLRSRRCCMARALIVDLERRGADHGAAGPAWRAGRAGRAHWPLTRPAATSYRGRLHNPVGDTVTPHETIDGAFVDVAPERRHPARLVISSAPRAVAFSAARTRPSGVSRPAFPQRLDRTALRAALAPCDAVRRPAQFSGSVSHDLTNRLDGPVGADPTR